MNKVIVVSARGMIYAKNFSWRNPLKQLQQIVGGWIETVYPQGLPRPYMMICNEEGAILGLPINPTASILYGYLHHGTPIHGDVAILQAGKRNGDPDIVGLSDTQASVVMDYILNTVQQEIRI